MQSPYPETREAYCMRCLFPVPEDARACAGCRAPFMGSGAFDLMRGPRPSPVFADLFPPHVIADR